MPLDQLRPHETPEFLAKNWQSHWLIKSNLDKLDCILFTETSLQGIALNVPFQRHFSSECSNGSVVLLTMVFQSKADGGQIHV